jgi:hypothetical protein
MRADTQVGPYGNDDNPMEMIWHDHEFAGFDRGEFFVQFTPPTFNHATGIVQPHLPIHNLPKQTFPIFGAVYGKGGFETRPYDCNRTHRAGWIGALRYGSASRFLLRANGLHNSDLP